MYAGIAQLVERNLAKVEVAGSNPVSRSNPGATSTRVLRRLSQPFKARWQSGHAADCNSVYAGSIPTRASNFLSCPVAKRFYVPLIWGNMKSV